MSDIIMPSDVEYGKVVGRFIVAVPDATDPDNLPEATAGVGSVKITPIGRGPVTSPADPALVIREPITCPLDTDGNLLDLVGEIGVWLVVGLYKVSYNITGARIRTHMIQVLSTHTDDDPLDVTSYIPPGGAILSASEYAELSLRLLDVSENSVSVDDPRLEDARTPLPHTHDDRYYTEAEVDSRLSAKATVDALLFEVDLRTQGDDDILEQLGNEITLRSQADTAIEGRVTDLENAVPDLSGYATDAELTALDGRVVFLEEKPEVDLSGYATDAELTSGLASKANSSHAHTSASITDFREAVEDAVAATLVGSGIAITHEDGSDTITLTGVAGADAEQVRDAIGAALIGVGPISIVPDDSGDTIIITVSATVNSTDAALRDRSTHTGQQAISTVTGLQTALDGKATAAQGAKADTAVQPADLSVYATDAELSAAISAVGSSSSVARWRGTWASTVVLSTVDLSSGIPAELTSTFGTTTNPGGTGAPSGTNVLWTGTVGSGPSLRSATVVIPAGVSQIRAKVKITSGFGQQTTTEIRAGLIVNGTQTAPTYTNSNAWTQFVRAVSPGDTAGVFAYTQYGDGMQAWAGQIELMGSPSPYNVGDLVFYGGSFFSSTVNNNASTPGADSNWVDLNITVNATDIIESTALGRSLLTTPNATAARTSLELGSAAQADAASFATPASISSAIAAMSRWRGAWSSIALIKAYDPIADGLSVGSLAVTNVSPPLSVLAKASCPITTGDLPLASNVYVVGKAANGVPYGAYSVTWTLTAPAGTTKIRFKHAFNWGPGGYGRGQVYVNGVLKRQTLEVNGPWLAFDEPLSAGQVVTVSSFTPFNSAGEAYMADIEFWGTPDPYHAGDLVHYANEFWQCASNGTTSTPGTDGTWTKLNLNAIAATLVDAKGDQLVGSANDTLIRKAVGTDGQVWTADAASPGGIKWATPSGGGGVLLLENGASVPGGTAVGTIIYEKAPTQTIWDFRGGALPASWAKRGSPTETFSGSGMAISCPVGSGYEIPIAGLPSAFVVDLYINALSSPGAQMFGAYALDGSNNGSAVTWYNAPQGPMVIGITGGSYNSSYVVSSGAPTAPCILRLRRASTGWYASASVNGGTSFGTETTVYNPAFSPTKIGFGGFKDATAVATIEKVTYSLTATARGGPRGWWDGSNIQPLT